MPQGFVIGDRILSASSGDTHPHWVAGYGTAGSYWVLAASAIGQSHLATNASRDDAVVVRSLGPWLAVGVSDGVGSHPLSRYGASYVADSLASRLVQPFSPPLSLEVPRAHNGPAEAPMVAASPPLPAIDVDEAAPASDVAGSGSLTWSPTIRDPIESYGEPEDRGESRNEGADDGRGESWSKSKSAVDAVPTIPVEQSDRLVESVRGAFRGAHASLVHYASALRLDPLDLSCTALGLLMNVETGQIAVGQVGDGAFFRVRDDQDVSPLLNLEDNEDLQSTHALSSEAWEQHFVGRSLEAEGDSLRAVLVTTDGISADLLYAPPATMQNWANKLCDGIQSMNSLHVAAERMVYEIATYSYQGSVDDRTLVVIMKR